jgi:hypothetical protein
MSPAEPPPPTARGALGGLGVADFKRTSPVPYA